MPQTRPIPLPEPLPAASLTAPRLRPHPSACPPDPGPGAQPQPSAPGTGPVAVAPPPAQPNPGIAPTQQPQPPSRIDRIRRYVEQYDGGECFFVAPVAIGEAKAAIEGYGASVQPFHGLDEAFKRDIGFSADIGVRQVTPQQCPAITLLG